MPTKAAMYLLKVRITRWNRVEKCVGIGATKMILQRQEVLYGHFWEIGCTLQQ